MNKNRKPLDKFGKFLMEHLRDAALDCSETTIRGKGRSPYYEKLQNEIGEMSERQKDVVRRCVQTSVDAAIHDFLFALQDWWIEGNEGIKIIVDGVDIVPLSDGIHGELFSEDGWQTRFSKYGEPQDNML